MRLFPLFAAASVVVGAAIRNDGSAAAVPTALQLDVDLALAPSSNGVETRDVNVGDIVSCRISLSTSADIHGN